MGVRVLVLNHRGDIKLADFKPFQTDITWTSLLLFYGIVSLGLFTVDRSVKDKLLSKIKV